MENMAMGISSDSEPVEHLALLKMLFMRIIMTQMLILFQLLPTSKKALN
jgi:hypothetical protein